MIPATGEIDGTVWTVGAARYAKDQAKVRHASRSGLKSRGDRIAEALGGRFSGRESAYIMSRTKAERWVELLQAGWDANFFNLTDARKRPDLIPPKERT